MLELENEIHTFLIIYGPNEGDKKQDIHEFQNTLQEEIEKEKGHLIIIGGSNGIVGNCPETSEECEANLETVLKTETDKKL